jgi:hypothetical protein
MCVAQAHNAMRLGEAITIYLAAGASFGVYNLQRERNRGSRFQIFLKAAHAMILWPLAAARLLSARGRQGKGEMAEATAERSAQFVEQIERAQRALLASLHHITRLTQVSSGAERAKVESAARAVREIVEKYAGLTLAAAESSPHAQPSEREMELCRVAGRRGEDLLLAGRCIHRRNAARLITHQARARIELLHALAEIRELAGITASATSAEAARHLSVATVRFYSHAFNLLSLLEDEAAARGVARLLDTECRRLRHLETLCLKKTPATQEELCQTHAPQRIFIGQSQLEASNQG